MLVEVVLVASVMSGAPGTAEQKYCQSYPNHVMLSRDFDGLKCILARSHDCSDCFVFNFFSSHNNGHTAYDLRGLIMF